MTSSLTSSISTPTSTDASGIIGIIMVAILWFVASWRLVFHYLGNPCDDRTDMPRVEGLTMRRSFHVLLWIALALEAIAIFQGILADLNEVAAFIIFQIGISIFHYLSFCVVSIYWLTSTANARAGASEKKKIFTILIATLVATALALTVTTLWEVVDLIVNFEDLDQYDEESNGHRRCAITQGVIWAIHGIIVLICCWMIVKRLKKVPSWKSLTLAKKTQLGTNKVCTMIICAICFLLRGHWVTVEAFRGSDDLWYWIGAVWIPTAIPSILLLYAFRSRDRMPGWIEGSSMTSQIPSVAPPEEAFWNFRDVYKEDANHDTDSSRGDEPLLDKTNEQRETLAHPGLLMYDFENNDDFTESMNNIRSNLV